MSRPVLALEAARAEAENLPRAALDLALAEGDFALIETPGPRRGAAFADLCMGLSPLMSGVARFLGRDWSAAPSDHADALRGHIGRLFHIPIRLDTPDVAARILLGRLHHTRIPEPELRAEAANLAVHFGLPGLPAGPARLLSEPDLLRAACVRAFIGRPRMIVLELPVAVQQDDLLPRLLEAGAEARGGGAAVMWLANPGPALRDRSISPTHRLRLSDAGIALARRAGPPRDAGAMKLLRNSDEWVGLLVLTSIALFIAAVLHAGLLSDWFRPTATLKVLLPETGSAGLSAGADITVLGTHVGTVRRIVVDPTQRMYAEAELDEQSTGFIRRDSVALIKKSFGVAGAAFLDISRGRGAPLDWHFAVIEAASERDPTESIGAILDQVKQKIFPVLDDAGRAMKALADTIQGISDGHGNIGRLVKDEDLVNQIAPMLANLKTATDQVDAELSDIRGLTATITRPQGVPALLKRVDAMLASVQSATRDLASAAPRLPAITRNAATATSDLPALLTQAQQTAADLEKLSNQLRHTWPLSGSAPPEPPRRLAPGEARP